MHSIKSNFDKILCILKEVLGESLPVSGDLLPLRPGPKPKFTDIEIIALSLVSECMGIDSELHFFSILNSSYKNDFSNLPSRRQYNDRRKSLKDNIQKLSLLISNKMSENTVKKEKLNEQDEVFIIDSMPLEICKFSRRKRNSWGNNDKYLAPVKGKCMAQDNKDYFGYKLHAICSREGVIKYFEIGKASQHDIGYVKENIDKICNNFSECKIYGDKGYLSPIVKEKLFEKAGVDLIVPSRKNQKVQVALPAYFGRVRKRIETVFSQLCDQFMIQRNYTKNFFGYETRIISKICGRSILQYINKFITNKPVGKVKYALK